MKCENYSLSIKLKKLYPVLFETKDFDHLDVGSNGSQYSNYTGVIVRIAKQQPDPFNPSCLESIN